MRVVGLEVDPMEGYANDPRLKLYVEGDPPRPERIVHHRREVGASPGREEWLYWGVHQSGYVSYALHVPSDENGYGGATFRFGGPGGDVWEVRGPWSSRAGVVNFHTGLRIFDCSFEPALAGGASLSGAITVHRAQHLLQGTGWRLVPDRRDTVGAVEPSHYLERS